VFLAAQGKPILRRASPSCGQDKTEVSPSSSLKRRSGDFGANFFGEVIHSHYVQIEKAM